MILSVGEILADMIGGERNGEIIYERKAGGAPFNVACAVKKFGGSSAFAGCVGDDLIGDFLIDYAKSRNLDALYIEKSRDRNTTLAFVQLDKSGERSFCFYRKNTADYALANLDNGKLNRADIVHIGSLMLSEKSGVKYAKNLAKRAHALFKTVSFDVNFRTDIFRDREEAASRYREIIKLADIVKLSGDEVELFGGYVSDFEDKLICISLGESGSEWRYRGKSGKVKSVAVKPVDTTGAGDAFFAGVLAGLDGTPKDGWTPEFLNGVFFKANVCGALNTLKKGAIDGLPDKPEIDKAVEEVALRAQNGSDAIDAHGVRK